jgi:hypothetical protein
METELPRTSYGSSDFQRRRFLQIGSSVCCECIFKRVTLGPIPLRIVVGCFFGCDGGSTLLVSTEYFVAALVDSSFLVFWDPS